ncbi:MAG TPA: hotdog fold thioesterase [Steroidobacteraceae bacterium]|nr:hotdog fold thioesterase [Steroidobacteraceae bacterium]
MSIWFRPVVLDEVRQVFETGMAAHLDIRLKGIGDDWLSGTMLVDHRTQQPMGLLHGGASAALAETLGSVAATLCIDYPTVRAIGQEINSNHIRAVSSGIVTGIARPIHIGHRSQVWGIEIRNPADKLVCISRLTMAVISAP